jgi:hypothetical protein
MFMSLSGDESITMKPDNLFGFGQTRLLTHSFAARKNQPYIYGERSTTQETN